MPSFGKLFHIRKPDDEKHPAGRTKVEAPATGHLHRTAVLDSKSTHSGAQAAVPSTPQMVGPNLSYSDHRPETTKNDGQVVGPAHAEAVLNEAAEKLEKAFPEDVQRKFQIKPIHGSADISSLSQSIQDVLGQIMDKDQIEEKEQTLVKAVTNTWVKKAIPFVQKRLSIAKDVVPAPYGLVVTGLLFVVERAKTISETAEKVSDMLVFLSKTIPTVDVDNGLPSLLQQKQLDGIQFAAISLTASIMECLTVLVRYITESALKKALLSTPDLDGAKKSVQDKVKLYYQATIKISTSLLVTTARKQQDNNILEWIWPKAEAYSLPKNPDEDNVRNSGDWFLALSEYKQWVGQGATTLICHGQPGSGKSHLLFLPLTTLSDCSSVVRNKLWDTPQIGLCSFLFKLSDLEQTASNVVRIALRQLVEQFEDLPQSVYTAYILAQKADRGNSPGINTSTKLLNACASDFFQTYSNPVFILVDALDEFVNKHEQDRQRDDLLSSLAGLCLEGHVKLLFTTRPQFREQLQEKFNDSVVIEATTDHNDVKKYLDSKLEYSDLPEDLKSSIKCTIAEQTGDIPFLLVKLQMDYVMEVLDPYEVGERLKSLPRDLTKAYGSVIERMRDKAFAGRILGWVLDAQRPMKMIELCVALSFHCEKLSFVELSQPTPQSILKTYGGLIEHNKENDLVTFSHAKAREYVMENQLETMAPHSTMALACILYCQDPNFKVVNDYDVQIEEHELPFGRYAATYWATHCKLAGHNVSVESKIFEAFNSEERCLTSIHYTGYFEYYPDGRLLPFLVHCGMPYLLMSPLPDAPFASIIEAILDTSQLKGLKSSGSAALMFAALHGYVDVAKWLCEKGVDVNSVNARESGTAIHLATYAGRMEFVKWLVDEMKFEVDAKDKYGKTPVHWAAMMGRLELLKWLVDEKKADCYATDNDEETPVTDSERLEVLKWLVEETHASFDGRHMAVSAIVNGRMDILKWWTEEGMDAYDSAGLPVLHLAAQLGQLEVVKWLVLEQHVNVAERAKVNVWTALHCGCSYLPVTRWLVEDQHLDVNAKGNMGETALQLAAEYGALEVVQWLVQISGDATVTDTSGKTPETAVGE